MRAGESSPARSHFQRAVKLDAQNADAWHALGAAHSNLGVRALAIKAFRTSVELRPNFADAHNDLGKALLEDGKSPEAIRSFQNALRFRKNDVGAIFNLARALESLDNASAAEEGYRQTLTMRSNHVDAMAALGALLARTQRFSEALPLLQLAHRLSPADASVANSLARALIDAGRFQEAAAIASSAVALAADNSAAWTTLGVAQRQVRDSERAIESLRRALQLDQNNTIAALELALVLNETGDIDEARTVWKNTRTPAGLRERVRWLHALSLPAIYRDDDEIDDTRDRFANGLRELNDGLKLDGTDAVDAALNAAAGVAPFFLHYQPRDNTDLQCRFGDLVTRVMTRAMPSLIEPCDWKLRSRDRVRVGIVSAHLMDRQPSRVELSKHDHSDSDRRRLDVRVWCIIGGILDASTAAIAANVDAFVDTRIDVRSLAQQIRAARNSTCSCIRKSGMDPKHQALAALRLRARPMCAVWTSGDERIAERRLFSQRRRDRASECVVALSRAAASGLPGLGTQPSRPPERGDGTWYDEFARERPLLLLLAELYQADSKFRRCSRQESSEETGICVGFFHPESTVDAAFSVRASNQFSRHAASIPHATPRVHSREERLQRDRSCPDCRRRHWCSTRRVVLWWSDESRCDSSGNADRRLAQGEMLRCRQTAGMLRLMGLTDHDRRQRITLH